MIVAGIALLVLWALPRFWLLGAFVVLAFIVAVVTGIDTDMNSAVVLLVGGPIAVVIRKTGQAFWRVERERWDEADRS